MVKTISPRKDLKMFFSVPKLDITWSGF